MASSTRRSGWTDMTAPTIDLPAIPDAQTAEVFVNRRSMVRIVMRSPLAVIGLILGGIAGYVGGVLDDLIMRFADIVLAFPIIILAMAIAAALGPSALNASIAMIAIWWPTYARVIRGLVIELREREFVLA